MVEISYLYFLHLQLPFYYPMFITRVGATRRSTTTNVNALVKKRMDDYGKRWKDVKDEEHTIFRVPRNL